MPPFASSSRRRCDGGAALNALQHQRWDVVVLDLMMPRMNGWELIEWLKEHADRRPRSVVVMSAAGHDALRDLDSTIVNAIFFKPFDVTQLGGYISGAARRDGPDRRRGRRSNTAAAR